jgi:hypothetical protein
MPKTNSDAENPEKDCVQVVISSFPKALRAELEAMAKRNNRTLSAEIRHQLAERMAEKNQPAAA